MAKKKTTNSEYVGTQEAAEMLDVRRPYITTLIRDGKLEALRLSERVYAIRRDSIHRYLRERRQFRMGGPRNDGSDYRSQHGDEQT
jgi:excisionase family DNA binding protein